MSAKLLVFDSMKKVHDELAESDILIVESFVNTHEDHYESEWEVSLITSIHHHKAEVTVREIAVNDGKITENKWYHRLDRFPSVSSSYRYYVLKTDLVS